MADLPVGLLGDVKNFLDITWTDTATDIKVEGFVRRGIDYLDRIAGESMDYTKESIHRELLLNYCLYARSNAFHEFKKNYLHELNGLQISKEVERFEATDV